MVYKIYCFYKSRVLGQAHLGQKVDWIDRSIRRCQEAVQQRRGQAPRFGLCAGGTKYYVKPVSAGITVQRVRSKGEDLLALLARLALRPHVPRGTQSTWSRNGFAPSTAFFMTLWRPRSRNDGCSCDTRWG